MMWGLLGLAAIGMPKVVVRPPKPVDRPVVEERAAVPV
jgi:hypothetical protein